MVRVARRDVISLLADVRSHVPDVEIAATLRDWSLEPVAPILERLGRHATQLAARLGKQVELHCEAKGARVDLAWLAPFFQGLVHALRNSVDHGLETPEVRQACGKPEVGKVALEVTAGPQGLVLRLEDDGRGVDWEAIGAKARAMGLPYETEADRIAALFHDGLSTAEAVTDISGRGVGLSALRSACEQLGIGIHCSSRTGQGTTFTFQLPPPRLTWRPPPSTSLAVPRSVSLRPMGMGRIARSE